MNEARPQELVGALTRELVRRRHDAVERAGELMGLAAAPIFAATSALRRARTFHPRGDCADAMVHVADEVPPVHRALAESLVGHAFVRFSDALTKKKARWPDVLGCALRFGTEESVEAGDQDLLFATIKRPWTIPFAPLTTRVQDYLANDYFAVSPFSVPSGERVYLRLHPDVSRSIERVQWRKPAMRRRRRLERAIANGAGVLVLGASSGPRGPFAPVVELHLFNIWQNDPPALRMDPFRSGRGLIPRGFVHALRRGAYSGSQLARPGSDRSVGA